MSLFTSVRGIFHSAAGHNRHLEAEELIKLVKKHLKLK